MSVSPGFLVGFCDFFAFRINDFVVLLFLSLNCSQNLLVEKKNIEQADRLDPQTFLFFTELT